jgi:predicted transposase YbfD/YdcC
VKLCFEDAEAPIAGRASSAEKGHGRTTRRVTRTSQVLHGYTDFPGLRQAVEQKRRVRRNRTGKVTDETAYAVLSLSPRRADAETCMKLVRRHWHVENKSNHVRDDSWREDRQVWRRGRTAYVMSMMLSIALNLLRAPSPHWRDKTPLTERAAIVNDLTLTPRKLFRRAS